MTISLCIPSFNFNSFGNLLNQVLDDSEQNCFKMIDILQENSHFVDALNVSLNCYKDDKNDVEILWRIARSYFDIADQSTDVVAQKENIDSALPYAENALSINPLSSKANHYYAVIIGRKGVLEGTKQKIINSYEVKKYCLKAIELDSTYDNSYHVMGRWHYNVADLSWVERNIASLAYATPPVGSFAEAINYFKSAKNLNPDDIRHYLWLGKSYLANYESDEARNILKEGMKIETTNESDNILKNKIKELLSKL